MAAHIDFQSIRGFARPTTRTDYGLWLLVVVAMGLDIVLTYYGLQHGLTEGNPIVLFGIETVGYATLALVKLPALGFGFIGWSTLPPKYYQITLVCLALPWVTAVISNSWLILTSAPA